VDTATLLFSFSLTTPQKIHADALCRCTPAMPPRSIAAPLHPLHPPLPGTISRRVPVAIAATHPGTRRPDPIGSRREVKGEVRLRLRPLLCEPARRRRLPSRLRLLLWRRRDVLDLPWPPLLPMAPVVAFSSQGRGRRGHIADGHAGVRSPPSSSSAIQMQPGGAVAAKGVTRLLPSASQDATDVGR
jgi:hypothetical protein